MTEKTIHTIAAATWTKYGKYRVELEIHGEQKQVYWMTPTQYEYLQSAFSHTKNGYSDSRCTVIGTFDDDKGYYIRCKAMPTEPMQQGNHYTPLTQEHNLDSEARDD